MSDQIKSEFNIENWEEAPFSEEENGPKLIRASVTQSYTGGIEGKGRLEYLMTTFNENFSRFVGIEQIVGKLDGREGSFVLNHEGTHEDGVAKSSFTIEPDSGTGELKGIRGQGNLEATHEEANVTLEYEFE